MPKRRSPACRVNWKRPAATRPTSSATWSACGWRAKCRRRPSWPTARKLRDAGWRLVLQDWRKEAVDAAAFAGLPRRRRAKVQRSGGGLRAGCPPGRRSVRSAPPRSEPRGQSGNASGPATFLAAADRRTRPPTGFRPGATPANRGPVAADWQPAASIRCRRGRCRPGSSGSRAWSSRPKRSGNARRRLPNWKSRSPRIAGRCRRLLMTCSPLPPAVPGEDGRGAGGEGRCEQVTELALTSADEPLATAFARHPACPRRLPLGADQGGGRIAAAVGAGEEPPGEGRDPGRGQGRAGRGRSDSSGGPNGPRPSSRSACPATLRRSPSMKSWPRRRNCQARLKDAAGFVRADRGHRPRLPPFPPGCAAVAANRRSGPPFAGRSLSGGLGGTPRPACAGR